MFSAVVAVAVLFAVAARAECPNACNSQGDCDTKDQCNCYAGFFGGDCSLRVCPVGAAFVDTPLGDLSHQGSMSSSSYSQVQQYRYKQAQVWPSKAKVNPNNAITLDSDGSVDPLGSNVVGGWAAQPGEGHFTVECSGKGSCDRELGLCDCFDGFTGAACQRTTCPNDCSGNGLCMTVGEISRGALNYMLKESAYGTNSFSGVLNPTSYNLWDADKNTACYCDPGFSGIDCSLRMCPRGDDPLTWEPYTCGTSECRNELQSFSVDGGQTGASYFLLFTDHEGWMWKTSTFLLTTTAVAPGSDLEAANTAAIKAALEGLPNGVAGTVAVTMNSDMGGATPKLQARFTVEFLTMTGKLAAMQLGVDSSVNPDTGSSFVFQPGQPLQTLNLTTSSGASNWFIQFQIFPTDQTLFGLSSYWQSDVTELGKIESVGSSTALSGTIAKALNSIPAVKLSYGAPFKPDANVVSTVTTESVNTLVSKIAFPDAVIGFNAIKYRRKTAPTGTSPTFTATDLWTTVDIPLHDNINGNKEAAVCSNRGICDVSTGLCNCFAGQTGSDCSQQSALARGSTAK